MNKIKNYITQSGVATRKMIRDSVDQYAMARGLEISQGLSDGYSHYFNKFIIANLTINKLLNFAKSLLQLDQVCADKLMP